MVSKCSPNERRRIVDLLTKDRILKESMALFSVYGFDSVSVRRIAEEVGVKNSALYKHFESKQAIFDAIVAASQERFFQKYAEAKVTELKTPEEFENMCIDFFLYQTKDPWIMMFRRMLMMEMFKNQAMAKVYKNIFIDMPVQYQKLIFQALIDQGRLKDANAEVMAMELYAPFFLYHAVEEDNERLEPLLRKHVRNFISNYMEEIR
jgi:TetR/AcrR family transcriptional repressor of uid operon